MNTLGKFSLGFLILFGVSLLTFSLKTCSIFQGHVEKSMENAVISYDDFQDMYTTCNKLNTDLGNMQAIPESDKQFEQFSKSQRLNSIKTNLNRWVEEYNAKSKHIDKGLWKSSTLPYQLDVNQFSNYNK
jgi:hypothetical protein